MNITSDSTIVSNVEMLPYYNSTSMNTSNFENGTVPSVFLEDTGTPEVTIILLSLLFFVIGVIGISGNMLVIVSVLSNKKMRTSMTNLLITNLALSDLAIMVFGIPEVVMFMRNTGWTLDPSLCKVNRYILVSSLYGSVLTLLALSVERYIAIIHPIKAHIFCNKRRLVVVLGCIWPVSWVAGLPTLLFNQVRQGHPTLTLRYCMIIFPGKHDLYFLVFKYMETLLFYFIPLVLQIFLYSFITKHLFIGTDRLYRRVLVRDVNGSSMERFSEALQARKGVVKMLILSVLVYFISYSPHQILLLWNTFAPRTFHENWAYLAFTMIVAYINSAANPILYSIFSHNFRQCYKSFVCVYCIHKQKRNFRKHSNGTGNSPRLWRHISLATASTNF